MTAKKRLRKSRPLTIRRLATIAAITAAWCALWQTVSVANLAAGFVLGTGVTALGIGTPAVGAIKLRPLGQLTWLVLVDLVKSTIGVAKEILTPTDRTDEAIIAVNIQPEAREHFLLLVVAVTLTPGTAVVDADPDTGTLYLHVLHHRQANQVKAHVHQIAALACRALPTSDTPITELQPL